MAAPVTSDIWKTGGQVSSLSSGTRLVTVSIGGNDAGFADVMTHRATWTGCNDQIARARAFVRDHLPGRLRSTYSLIRMRAPNARVVVFGYPRLFSSRHCGGTGGMTLGDRQGLNQLSDEVVEVTSREAWARGFQFRDVRGNFANHWVCSDVEWLNGLSWPRWESYHPNRSGHRSGHYPHLRDEIVRGGIRGH